VTGPSPDDRPDERRSPAASSADRDAADAADLADADGARRAEARAAAAKAAARDAARATDPVLAKRARIARLVSIGQRLGYSLFGLAVLAFAVGFATGFTSTVVVIIEICFVVGSVVLAPAIVFGYGVKAADREDREQGR
jgi:hypothetical protein